MRAYSKPYKPARDSVIEHLIDALGFEFVRRLASAIGGKEIRTVRVETLHSEHAIVRLLGWNDAKALCSEVFGELFYVPTIAEYSPPHEEYLAKAIFRQISVFAIADELNVSMRHVRRLVAQSGWGSSFRRIHSNSRASNAEWVRRNHIIGEFVAGRISACAASGDLACTEQAVHCWAKLFIRFGCIAQRLQPPCAATETATAANSSQSQIKEPTP